MPYALIEAEEAVEYPTKSIKHEFSLSLSSAKGRRAAPRTAYAVCIISLRKIDTINTFDGIRSGEFEGIKHLGVRAF